MLKFLFFDCRELEICEGFRRELGRPAKHGTPLFVADQPWENGNMQLYGSVLKAPGGPFQCWYSVIHRPFNIYLCYAESDDGVAWRRTPRDVFEMDGRKTNIVFPHDPHGPAVIYDPDDPHPGWRYKMMCGAAPTQIIGAFRSSDGVHWHPVRRFGAIATNPDCPMGFLRAPDGRFVAYHRLATKGRRVFRSESWDFRFWSGEPRMVFEPDASDPPQLEFYGLGAAAYGPYEIGTLWAYHTEADDTRSSHMRGYQETELAYARSGYAWHRAAQGQPFLPHGAPTEWDCGNLQCASQPVFLDGEIRYYYMGTDMRHQRHWELEPQTAGLGMARLRPDGFVALVAGDSAAELFTCAFQLPGPRLFVNADAGKDGWIRMEVAEADGTPVEGLSFEDCEPFSGDSLAGELRWRSGAALPLVRPIRLRLRAVNTRLFSVFAMQYGEKAPYWQFQAPRI